MKSVTNQHGLSREIPEHVKRQVRRACGFGCVICGASITQYEHIDPTFADAEVHDPNAITLLCYQCHGMVTKEIWSKQKVKDAQADPYCLRAGFSNAVFELGKSMPYLSFAGLTLKNCKIPILLQGRPLFMIEAGEAPGAPFRFSGLFFNSSGEPSFEIGQNEWRAYASNWDVEFVGPAITIRDDARDISLKLVADPPHGLKVEKIDMLAWGFRFTGDVDTLVVAYPDGSKRSLTKALVDGFKYGIAI